MDHLNIATIEDFQDARFQAVSDQLTEPDFKVFC